MDRDFATGATRCHFCGRQLTKWEKRSPSSVVHVDNRLDGYDKYRQCQICFYRHADPDDYGKPTIYGAVRVWLKRTVERIKDRTSD